MLLMAASVVVTVMLAVDVNNDATQAVQFDWIETLCSLLSGAASVILGVVAIMQEERANRLNAELAEIDRMQFENASVTANYPLVKFNQTQVVDWERRELVLRLVDVKEVALKEMWVSDMHFYPYSAEYRAEEEDNSVVVQKDGVRAKVKSVAEEGREGVYEVAIKANPELFAMYERFCLEFNLEVVNGAEVAIIYKFKLLVEGVRGRKRASRRRKEGMEGEARRQGEASGEANRNARRQGETSGEARRGRRRRRPGKVKVFHQFYEIEATMGEKKWEEAE